MLEEVQWLGVMDTTYLTGANVCVDGGMTTTFSLSG
jgi:hypothetical protein